MIFTRNYILLSLAVVSLIVLAGCCCLTSGSLTSVKSTNTLAPDTLVSVSLADALPQRASMTSTWNEKDSWGNYTSQITSLSGTDACNAMGAITPPDKFQECSSEKAAIQGIHNVDIVTAKANDLDSAKELFNNLKGSGQKISDNVQVGNEMFTTEDKSHYNAFGYNAYQTKIVFRRNNVVVSIIGTRWDHPVKDIKGPSPDELKKEIGQYAVAIDNKLQ